MGLINHSTIKGSSVSPAFKGIGDKFKAENALDQLKKLAASDQFQKPELKQNLLLLLANKISNNKKDYRGNKKEIMQKLLKELTESDEFKAAFDALPQDVHKYIISVAGIDEQTTAARMEEPPTSVGVYERPVQLQKISIGDESYPIESNRHTALAHMEPGQPFCLHNKPENVYADVRTLGHEIKQQLSARINGKIITADFTSIQEGKVTINGHLFDPTEFVEQSTLALNGGIGILNEGNPPTPTAWLIKDDGELHIVPIFKEALDEVSETKHETKRNVSVTLQDGMLYLTADEQTVSWKVGASVPDLSEILPPVLPLKAAQVNTESMYEAPSVTELLINADSLPAK